MVRGRLPAGVAFGETELIDGVGRTVPVLVITNGSELEAPTEFFTATWTVPANAAFVAGMAGVSCVALPKVVGCAAPFQFTTASLVKFVPVTVSVKPCALQYGVE